MSVPFVDLARLHEPLWPQLQEAMAAVVRRNAFILGEEVAQFERAFAAYCEARYCVGLDNGSSALELALRVWGIGEGDDVITAPNSFIATASAIAVTGARPVFVDIDPRTYTLDVSQLEAAITPRTKALIPVHLYGQPADMDPLLDIARRHGLYVLEDACQAHGARYKGRRVGSLGDAAAFSFYPAKNLGCFGDGGALTTNDAALAERVAQLRHYGQRKKYEHIFLAYNRRLDTLQAAVLNVKLPHLEQWNAARRRLAARYTELLADVVQTPVVADYAEHVFHLYVVRVPQRERVAARLKEAGIDTGQHYPIPIHLQEAYRYLGYEPGAFPEAERACQEALSLPMFPGLTEEEMENVAAALKKAVQELD